jgi:membrane protein implicated in regulation of membrane protease activity
MDGIVWLILLILFLVVEGITVGLVSIWLAGGALVALLLQLLGASIMLQILMFFLTSFALLVFTRPIVRRYLNVTHESTNCERFVGKYIKITERVDNMEGTGRAILDDQEWMVRAKVEGETFEVGEIVRIVEISGVKLLVTKET